MNFRENHQNPISICDSDFSSITFREVSCWSCLCGLCPLSPLREIHYSAHVSCHPEPVEDCHPELVEGRFTFRCFRFHKKNHSSFKLTSENKKWKTIDIVVILVNKFRKRLNIIYVRICKLSALIAKLSLKSDKILSKYQLVIQFVNC